PMPTPFADLAARRGVVFPLRTERLTLTPFAADDAPAVFDFCCLQEVWTWTSGRLGPPPSFGRATSPPATD
ncbi:hypothetical protein GS438_21805, partial [Rhodococcus hoagii]|nr:hypothetical protein [Prescottella equi]